MREYKKRFFVGVLLILSVCLSACGRQKDNEKTDFTKRENTTENVVIPETTEHTTEGVVETKSSEQGIGQESEAEPEEPSYLYDLETSLQEAITDAGLSSNTAVYIQKLSQNAYAAIGNRSMESASLIKLYVAGCVYEQMDMLVYTEAYAGETEELVKKMITISDNDATNTLVTRLGNGDAQEGMNLINVYCKEYGFTDTSMGRLMLDFSAQSDNYTSVQNCAKFLQMIYNKELAGSEEILGYLKLQERTGKIPAGVPEGVITANKTGELEDVENDAAIVMAENEPYIICVMMDALSDTAAGRDAIVKISAITYTYMNR